MKTERESGVLLHITSLPSPGGIGSLGKEAYEFADFLKGAGVTLWQMLPVGPTGYGESPYQSPSTHAGNPLLIDGRMLVESGLLDRVEEEEDPSPHRVDFEKVRPRKMAMLRRAFELSWKKLETEIGAYRQKQEWVEDYALFEAARSQFGHVPLESWPDEGLRMRREEALAHYRQALEEEINFHVFVQYLFDRQWERFKFYANSNGIRLIGDIPIYVSADSADVWADPQAFRLDENGRPAKVGGVPPDCFSEGGQLWGNPCYNWKALKKKRYAWWVRRMATMARRFDIVRIDHFIGFANYYAVDQGMPDARIGKWKKGPGKALFKALKEELPRLEIIAEDLGERNPRVEKLLRWTGYPGMEVLHYACDGDVNHPGLPGQVKKNLAYYTSTHDNDTSLGWWMKATEHQKAVLTQALDLQEGQPVVRAMVRGVLASKARYAIIPMQDYLQLDSWARMNFPGTVGGDNWRWRMEPDGADEWLREQIALMNREAHRGRKKSQEGKKD